MHLGWNGALRGVPAVGVAPYRARGPGARRSLAIGEGILVVRGMLWDGVCHCGPRMPELWVFCVLWGSAGAIGAKGASPPLREKAAYEIAAEQRQFAGRYVSLRQAMYGDVCLLFFKPLQDSPK